MGAWEDGFASGYRAGMIDAAGEGPGSKDRRGFVSGWDRKPARKRVGKKDPKMARALKKANAMGRKKNGSLKKGWTQSAIMRKAHWLRRRMK